MIHNSLCNIFQFSRGNAFETVKNNTEKEHKQEWKNDEKMIYSSSNNEKIYLTREKPEKPLFYWW